MVTDRAICYVSSVDYLLPSIISASTARKYVPAHKADIFIFLNSTDTDLIARVNKFLSLLDIKVCSLDGGSIGQLESQDFDGYIKSTTLGRFFIASLLPTTCRHIIYIDGDTWVRYDPLALVEAEVPDGRFTAAEDIISFRCNEFTPAGRKISTYFKGLGVDPAKGYFNSGVFAVSRSTWLTLAAEAFEFFKHNREVCNCLDQSALNAVMGDRRLKLSLKWNFQSPARFMGIEGRINPAIYHFTQYIKPWMAECKPWQEMYAEYQTALVPFKALDLPLPMASTADIEGHNKLNWMKNLLLKSPPLAGLSSLHTGIRAYEHNAWI